jgi:hypothetical protein
MIDNNSNKIYEYLIITKFRLYYEITFMIRSFYIFLIIESKLIIKENKEKIIYLKKYN